MQLAAPRLQRWEQALFEQAVAQVRPPEPVELDRLLLPGDGLGWEIEAELIAAPGHTPGQLAVWIPKHRTLITADALATHDGWAIVSIWDSDPGSLARCGAARAGTAMRRARYTAWCYVPVIDRPVATACALAQKPPPRRCWPRLRSPWPRAAPRVPPSTPAQTASSGAPAGTGDCNSVTTCYTPGQLPGGLWRPAAAGARDRWPRRDRGAARTRPVPAVPA